MLDLLLKYSSVGALLIACVTGTFGVKGYLLSRRIQRESKEDEVLLAGTLQSPNLATLDHQKCVLWTTLLNKGKRKAVVSRVLAREPGGHQIAITWADEIDPYGNPMSASQILGVVDTCPLYVRRNDGMAFRFDTRVEVTHSLKSDPLVLVYRGEPNWVSWATQ